jgi:hypothetical protein
MFSGLSRVTTPGQLLQDRLSTIDVMPDVLTGSLLAAARAGRFRVLEVRAALASGGRAGAGRLLEEGVEVPDIREGELSMPELWRQAFPGRPVPERYDYTMS